MMYDKYLGIYQADYLAEVLIQRPTSSLPLLAKRSQSVYETDGGFKEYITYSKNPYMKFTLEFKNLKKDKKDKITELYIDTNKADGMKRSFRYKHPLTGDIYVCRFTNQFQKTLERNLIFNLNSLDVDVLGIDKNLINLDEWYKDGFPNAEYVPI